MENELKGVHGWLAFFVFTLGLSVLLDVAAVGNSGSAVFIAILLAEAALTVYAIVLLLKLKARGITVAKVLLTFHLLMGILSLIAGALKDGLHGIVYATVWFAYLSYSQRVKNTYYPQSASPETAAKAVAGTQ